MQTHNTHKHSLHFKQIYSVKPADRLLCNNRSHYDNYDAITNNYEDYRACGSRYFAVVRVKYGISALYVHSIVMHFYQQGRFC